MLASVAAVDPLPLVPAIKMEGNLSCGFPSAPAKMRIWLRSNSRREVSPGRGASSYPRANKCSTAAWYPISAVPFSESIIVILLDCSLASSVLQRVRLVRSRVSGVRLGSQLLLLLIKNETERSQSQTKKMLMSWLLVTPFTTVISPRCEQGPGLGFLWKAKPGEELATRGMPPSSSI